MLGVVWLAVCVCVKVCLLAAAVANFGRKVVRMLRCRLCFTITAQNELDFTQGLSAEVQRLLFWAAE